jgi:hypothetical protein
MIDLFNNETNALLGSIEESELTILINALEEESEEDQDYYIDGDTIDLIAESEGSERLAGLLRSALGEAEGLEIRWQRRSDRQ